MLSYLFLGCNTSSTLLLFFSSREILIFVESDNNDDQSYNTDGIYNRDTVNIDENKDSDYIGYDYNHSRNEMRNDGGDVRIKIEDSSRIVHQPYTYNEIEMFMLNSKYLSLNSLL